MENIDQDSAIAIEFIADAPQNGVNLPLSLGLVEDAAGAYWQAYVVFADTIDVSSVNVKLKADNSTYEYDIEYDTADVKLQLCCLNFQVPIPGSMGDSDITVRTFPSNEKRRGLAVGKPPLSPLPTAH